MFQSVAKQGRACSSCLTASSSIFLLLTLDMVGVCTVPFFRFPVSCLVVGMLFLLPSKRSVIREREGLSLSRTIYFDAVGYNLCLCPKAAASAAKTDNSPKEEGKKRAPCVYVLCMEQHSASFFFLSFYGVKELREMFVIWFELGGHQSTKSV